MSEVEYYHAKAHECLRLAEGHTDLLSRDVYQAMAQEFQAKAARLHNTGFGREG